MQMPFLGACCFLKEERFCSSSNPVSSSFVLLMCLCFNESLLMQYVRLASTCVTSAQSSDPFARFGVFSGHTRDGIIMNCRSFHLSSFYSSFFVKLFVCLSKCSKFSLSTATSLCKCCAGGAPKKKSRFALLTSSLATICLWSRIRLWSFSIWWDFDSFFSFSFLTCCCWLRR